MSRQNPFARSTGDRFGDNCQNSGQNNCNDQYSCCNDCEDCHDKDNNPCIVCPPGPVGPQGIPGGVLSYADFYALMPPDNSATVAPGTDVRFPQNGPIANTNIGRTGPSSFNLGPIGTYLILFQDSVTEAGQLILTLNGEDLEYTVAGRATGTSQIVGMAVVTTETSTRSSPSAILRLTPRHILSHPLPAEPAPYPHTL